MPRARSAHDVDARFALDFDAAQWAVTPGQSAVLYDGELCLGGGVIDRRALTWRHRAPLCARRMSKATTESLDVRIRRFDNERLA